MDSGNNRDLKKLLGNPKITFILGIKISLVSLILNFNRWSRFRKRNSMR